MPFDIDQDLIANTPGGIAAGQMGGGGGGAGMGGAINPQTLGLLKNLLMGQQQPVAAAPNGAISPTGEALTGPPTMQRQGGLLAGLMHPAQQAPPVQQAPPAQPMGAGAPPPSGFMSRFMRRR